MIPPKSIISVALLANSVNFISLEGTEKETLTQKGGSETPQIGLHVVAIELFTIHFFFTDSRSVECLDRIYRIFWKMFLEFTKLSQTQASNKSIIKILRYTTNYKSLYLS